MYVHIIYYKFMAWFACKVAASYTISMLWVSIIVHYYSTAWFVDNLQKNEIKAMLRARSMDDAYIAACKQLMI